MGMIRSMLFWAGLFKQFWAEVIVTVIYILNRVVSSVLSGRIFYEAFWGRKSSLLYLRVFGLSVFVYISEVKRSKLDNKFVFLIFLGYFEEFKVYKLYDKNIFKIVLARSAVVSEFIKFIIFSEYDILDG